MSLIATSKHGDCDRCGDEKHTLTKKVWDNIENRYKGKKFGRWLIGAFVECRGKRIYYFECTCDCGKVRIREIKSIKDGRSTSCGCYAVERCKEVLTTHNMKNTKEYKVWAGMKTRCYNKKRKQYKDYGGRGIVVCDRWVKSFDNFFSDMGERPSPKHSIERRDNDRNYEPDNCYWGTSKIQSSNKSNNVHIEWNGQTKLITHWSIETKMPLKTLSLRYHRGLRGDELFFKGKYKSVKKIK